jgi:hypothetical protein
MARPNKKNLDYFSLDVILDCKVEKLEAKHGIIGFGIWIKLLQRIYRESYFIKWDDDEKWIFRKQTGVRIELLEKVIEDMIRLELLSKEIYDKYAVLTSRGIQKMYVKGSAKRKNIAIEDRYCLIATSDTDGIFFVKVDSLDSVVNSTETIVTSDINTINKTETENKEKENEIKEEKEITSNQNLDSYILSMLNAGVSPSLTKELVVKYKRDFIEDLISSAKSSKAVKNKIGWVKNYLETNNLTSDVLREEEIDPKYVSDLIDGIVSIRRHNR